MSGVHWSGQSGYAAFLASRVRDSRMKPSALSRAARLWNTLDVATRQGLFQFGSSQRVPLPDGPLRTFPATLGAANLFLAEHHRHHGPTTGHLFSIGLRDDSKILGYAIVGRPLSRHLDDGATVEVLRVATLGTRNGCSKLYGAVRQALNRHNRCVRRGENSELDSPWLRGKPISRIVTYTLFGLESGASLRASGFQFDGLGRGGSWNRAARPRKDRALIEAKIRWSQTLL